MPKNLTITTKEIDIYPTQQKRSTYYEDKIFSAIKYMRDRKQRPDVDAIFKHRPKNKASNISKDFTEDSMTKLLKEGKVINKKKSERLDSFYSNIKNQEHHPSLNKVESQNKDQTSIAIPNQIDVNITKHQHELETPIAKKKSKPPKIPILPWQIGTFCFV